MKPMLLHNMKLRLLPVLLILIGMTFQVRAQVLRSHTSTKIIPNTFFGMHIHHLLQGAPQATPWPTVPFGAWRLWDAYVPWPNIEPKKGEWNFTPVDKYVDLAQEHGVDVLLPLGLSPPWASSDPTGPYDGHTAPPKNMDDWRNFVRTVATRYKGRIHEYEIWNEPNLPHFYSGNVEQMIALTREASQILKSIDPTITVVSPSPTASKGVPWLNDFLAKGGGQYVDVIGFHLYVNPSPPEAMTNLIQQIQGIMKQYGAQTKEIWDTENGWASVKSGTSQGEQNAYVARAYVIQWAEGVSRFYWYSWDNQKYTLQMTKADNRTVTSAAVAYGEVEKWLVGATMTHCDQYSGTWDCHLQRPGGYSAWIVWNTQRSYPFSISPSWHANSWQDLQGETHDLKGAKTVQVSSEPIMIVSFGHRVP